ncbi:MAG: AAA-like domain-containing protein [Ardenticatenaceae bacterium]
MKKQIARYDVIRELGWGGMSVVYLAYDPVLEREVALKVLRPQLAKDQEIVVRFRNEAIAAASLQHPNIIQVYDFGEEEGGQYLTMPYIATGTLQHVFKREGPLSAERAVELLVPIAGALDEAHGINLVHRDIKPSNILIDAWSNPILTDFGVARLMSRGNLTAPGTIVGTTYYMSPEQAAGESVDKRADIYSLGVVLYQGLTGQYLFSGDTATVRFLHQRKSPPLPRSINPTISPAFEAVILKALAKKPDERFQSAGQMAQAMQQALHSPWVMPEGASLVASRPSSGGIGGIGEGISAMLGKLWQLVTQLLRPLPEEQDFPPIDTRLGTRVVAPSRQMVAPSPQMVPVVQAARLFICYEDGAAEDQKLARYLCDDLSKQGYQVFMNHSVDSGIAPTHYLAPSRQANDWLVVLLSRESAYSKRLHANVRRAYEYRKLEQGARVLPVRMAYKSGSAMDHFLDPRQYVFWQSAADNQRVAEEIVAALEGRFPLQQPLSLRAPTEKKPWLSSSYATNVVPDSSVEEKSANPPKDGPLIDELDALPAPQPEVNSGLLDELEPIGGAVMSSQFYIERVADARLKRQVVRAGVGTLTTIRAPRQTGKTSLLVQGVQQARQHGNQVVNLDMQRVDKAYLETPERFLRYLAEYIVWQLELDMERVAQVWGGPLGPQDKLTRLLGRYVLPESNTTIMLAIDEVDRLLETSFHTDFFALVRSWHNNRAFDPAWRKLNLVLIISTEPHLLIADVNQSPFNVGLKLHLEDFSEEQVRDLNQRHGSPLQESEVPELMALLNGHPYLTRQALYSLVTEPLNWSQLKEIALSAEGPFAEHLQRYHKLLHHQQNLKSALKQVIAQNCCPDEMTLYRLLRAGLVTGNSDKCACRCNLYRIYFENKL